MSKGDNSPGLSKLAGVMKALAENNADTSLVLDFGGIQSDGSLVTNTCPVPIPLADYSVCRRLIGCAGHAPTEYCPGCNGLPKLKRGDRVLVGWVQNDAVVIDVIIPAAELI